MLDQITPVILTKDEAPNIGRTLGQLRWARQVIVVDSGSIDDTRTIATAFPNVRFVERTFDTLAGQSNYGIAESGTDWVLLLDADYFVPDDFTRALAELKLQPDVGAVISPFAYAVNGKVLRASLYPPRVVLLKKGDATVWQDGHAHRVRVNGATVHIDARIIHDDRKPFSRFVQRQKTYMREEARKLRAAPWVSLRWPGRIRRLIVIAPFAVLVQTVLVKGLILDGSRGFRYTAERVIAETILSIELLRRRDL